MMDWSLKGILEIENELIESIARAERPARDLKDGESDSSRAGFFSDVIYGIGGLRFEEEEARRHWRGVLEHNRRMSRQMGRNMSVQIAAIDYFKNYHGGEVSPEENLSSSSEKNDSTPHTARFSVIEPLTGLYNHRYFQEALSHFVQAGRRWGQTFSVLVFDIDGFKRYNEEYGYLAGDVALSETAHLILPLIRQGLDVAARYGGGSFGVLFPATTRSTSARAAERIRAVMAAHSFSGMSSSLEGGGLTVSGGLAVFPVDGTERETLIAKAEQLLHQAKREGRNRILCSDFQPQELDQAAS